METVHACMEFLLNSKSDLLLVRIGEEAYKELQEAKVNSAFSKVAEAIKW